MGDSENQEIVPRRLRPAIRIRRGFIGEITIHQITDEELETLSHGHPESTYLNYSIFLLSISTAFLIALLTCTVPWLTFIVFVMIMVFGYSLGFLLFILWYRSRQVLTSLVQKIKDRLPPEGNQAIFAVLEENDDSSLK